MFYDVFCDLCEKKGVSPTRATVEIGLSRTIGTKWKTTGATPSGETLSKIAAYFDVSTDYLLGKENKPAALVGAELVKDEFIGFYGEVKEELTQDDIDDLLQLMRIRAELNRNKKE